jgi:hypothetical protein
MQFKTVSSVLGLRGTSELKWMPHVEVLGGGPSAGRPFKISHREMRLVLASSHMKLGSILPPLLVRSATLERPRPMSDVSANVFDPRSAAAQNLKEYPYFTARPVATIDNGPAWNSYEIGVFEHRIDGEEVQIGSYERNYAFLKTFWWFRSGARHFALFSPNYTAAGVMEIRPGEGFEDIAGEEPQSSGFCPVEFYVPDWRSAAYEEEAVWARRSLIGMIP